MALVAGLALVSCNENFDENMPAINYPDTFELGMWENDLAGENDTKYTVNLTLNEKGDTICDVTFYDPVSKRYNVISNGKASYNKRLGMVVADFTDSPYETPARVAINFTNDLKRYIVNVYSKQLNGFISEAHFVPVKTKSIAVFGDWRLADGTLLHFNPDGATVSMNGAEGTYKFEGTEGTVTVGGKTYKMTLNEKGQMFFTENGGQPQYATHAMTPLPDDWVEYASGLYKTWMTLYGLTNQENLTLEYSDYREKGRIRGFYGSHTMNFKWKKGSASVTLLESVYNTNIAFTEQGDLMNIYPSAISSTDSRKVVYSNVGYGKFTFGMEYGDMDKGMIFDANYQDAKLHQDEFIIQQIYE